MDNNIKVLNEIHKGLVMGMESISVVKSKVDDNNFRNELEFQSDSYGEILDRVNNEFHKLGYESADDTSSMQKIMGWTGIQFNTITDKSNSHIAELLINGNSMGIIEGAKQLNQNPNSKPEVKQIVSDFVTLQQNNIEKLKTFL